MSYTPTVQNLSLLCKMLSPISYKLLVTLNNLTIPKANKVKYLG